MSKKTTQYITLGLAAIFILSAASCGRTNVTGDGNGKDFRIETKEPITLEYLRLFDDIDVLDDIIASYQDKNPNIDIVVRKYDMQLDKTIYDYQQDIIKQIADGAGPDMFMIHNDWLPYHKDQITVLPSSLITTKSYAKDYPDVVVGDFVDNDKIYAIPYYMDNLILFYNTRIFEDANSRLKPPTTWSELADLVPQLTKRDSNGKITQSAISLGVADGIPRASDILATLIMQYGGEMTNPDHSSAIFNLPVPNSNPPTFPGAQALSFYTEFSNPDKATYTYNDNIDNKGNREIPIDVQAFIDGKTAMFIGYSYHVAYIKKFAPSRFRFRTAPLPQLTRTNPAVIANYWGETVSRNSEHPNEAWDFIQFAASKAKNTKYLSIAQRAPARLDKQKVYESRTYYGPVANQINFSKSWYRKNTTKVEDVFTKMINDVIHNNILISTAVDNAVKDINLIN